MESIEGDRSQEWRECVGSDPQSAYGLRSAGEYVSAEAAETLRRAAVAIRKDQGINQNLGHIDMREYETWLAVAYWLEVTERDVGSSSLAYHAALGVARTYLGEPAIS